MATILKISNIQFLFALKSKFFTWKWCIQLVLEQSGFLGRGNICFVLTCFGANSGAFTACFYLFLFAIRLFLGGVLDTRNRAYIDKRKPNIVGVGIFVIRITKPRGCDLSIHNDQDLSASA